MGRRMTENRLKARAAGVKAQARGLRARALAPWPLALALGGAGLFGGAAGAQPVPLIEFQRSDLPDEYVVEPGDTLWGLCEVFYRDPWRWPTVWALNPHVTNPHWIYPGDLLRLRMPEGVAGGPGGGLPALTFTLNSAEASHVASQEGFITEEEVETLGSLHRSPVDAAWLGEHDIVYLRLKDLDAARPGDRMTLFRVVRDVVHPESGEVVGQKILVLGNAEILGIDKHYARARVSRSFQELARGDKLMKLRKHHQRVAPKQNLIDLESTLVDDLLDIQELGQAHVVFIDRGEKDGVQVGNRLFVLRRADGHLDLDEESTDKLPTEQIGEVMVLETQDRSSTALVTRSTRELRRGDRLVMERNY